MNPPNTHARGPVEEGSQERFNSYRKKKKKKAKVFSETRAILPVMGLLTDVPLRVFYSCQSRTDVLCVFVDLRAVLGKHLGYEEKNCVRQGNRPDPVADLVSTPCPRVANMSSPFNPALP